MSNNYESIIGKDQNVTNDNLGKSEKYNRIIEIPVQHISSGGESTSNFDREKSPLYNSKSQSPHRSNITGFPKSSIFERFESPFGNLICFINMQINRVKFIINILDSPLSHRFDNRELDNRFPLLSRFDDTDNFFEPSLTQNHTNSIFDRDRSKNLLEKLKNQSLQRQNNNNGPSFQSMKNYNIDNRNSPDPDSTSYVSQAYIQPKTEINSNSKTVPIQIHHKSISPQHSDFTGYYFTKIGFSFFYFKNLFKLRS
jgi:hypothetical protein